VAIAFLFPFSGVGAAYTADSAAASETQTTFTPLSVTAITGRFGKNNVEANSFFAWNAAEIPLGSVINGVKFRFTVQTASLGSGSFRIGYLLQDNIWNVSGFARDVDVTGGNPFYATALVFPHATAAGSLAIIPGKIFFNMWSTSAIPWTAGGWQSGDVIAIGSGFGDEDFDEFDMLGNFAFLRNVIDQTIIGMTMDSQAVPNATNFVVHTQDAGGGNQPFFIVDYDPNPPVFTTTQGDAVLWSGDSFAYDSEADPWSLGDRTLGTHLGVAYSLVTGPTGLTINSSTGLVEWTPTAGDLNTVNPVTIRATNDGGLTVDQSWTIYVRKKGCPSGDVRTSAAVGGSPAHSPAAGGDVQPAAAVGGGLVTSPSAGGGVRSSASAGGFVRVSPAVGGAARASAAVGGESRGANAVGGDAEAAAAVGGEATDADAVGGDAVVDSAVGGFVRICPED
jgi:hypothetical protein